MTLIRGGRSGALVALLVLTFGGASATADPVWLPPIDLANGSGGVGDVTASMNGRGDAVVVWREKHNFLDEMSVHAAIRSGGVFGSPAEISPPDPDGVEPHPQVVLDTAGNALALWELWPWTIQMARHGGRCNRGVGRRGRPRSGHRGDDPASRRRLDQTRPAVGSCVGSRSAGDRRRRRRDHDNRVVALRHSPGGDPAAWRQHR